MATSEPSPDVPLFLRKTYHMIDTCDPDVACWSDDGETFVVKDPVRFEQTIIPQFFKHSKFSSFVRQLNFYSFRKIKYSDTLRIDPKLEAETANYWRFKHESFQRGKPQLLNKIKRMQGTSGSSTTSKSGTSSASSPSHVVSQATASQAPQPDAIESTASVTTEVQTLKKRIEEMSKNIDELTAMVKEVSIKQEEVSSSPPSRESEVDFCYEDGVIGAKRRKWAPSTLAEEEVRPDEMISSMDLDDDMIALPVASMPESEGIVRETSSASTQISDIEFVDTLFTAFKDEQGDDVFVLDDGSDDLSPQPQQLPSTASTSSSKTSTVSNNSNRPDAELMRRLSDALMLLPKEMQEMIVNRLIAAITSTDFFSGAANGDKINVGKNKVEMDGLELPVPVDPLPHTEEEDQDEQPPPFPLAAATLAALLRHYTAQLQHGKSHAANKSGAVEKSIPVIPVHA